SAEEIAEALDSRGIALAAVVTRQAFTLSCTCLSEDFDAVLALLGDIVTSPTVPDAELNVRKAEVLTAIQQDHDNPAVRAVEGLMGLLYPNGHPYGRPAKGTADSLERLTRDRLIELHTRWFAPAKVSVVVVGDVSSDRVGEVAAAVFGSWRRIAAEPA